MAATLAGVAVALDKGALFPKPSAGFQMQRWRAGATVGGGVYG
jgi:hypothetical protein